jgi:hypothetical protein
MLDDVQIELSAKAPLSRRPRWQPQAIELCLGVRYDSRRRR